MADRFDLGPDARLEVEAARGEQGQVRRLLTAHGSYAVKESFDEVDAAEAEATAAFQARCHAAGAPCPRPVPDRDGHYLADIDGEPIRVQTWVDIEDPDPLLDPAAVGAAVAALHAVVVPDASTPHWWHTEPVGAAEWRALVKASRAAGAPYVDRLAALLPALLVAEELLTPMAGVQWCHLDLWADNLRGSPGQLPVAIDFDNAGPADPDRELAMVLFEFARTERHRLEALVTAYDGPAAAPGCARRRTSASRSRSCTTSAGTTSSGGCTPGTPRRGHARTPASRSSSATPSCGPTSTDWWAGWPVREDRGRKPGDTWEHAP